MNSNTTGVIPTFDVSRNGNNSWGGSMGEWIIGLVALGMLGNGGMFGGFGGGNGAMMYEFPWLLAGQQGINTNTNNGFDTLHLSNQIEGVRDGVNNLSTQLCSSTADIVQSVNNGFANAEISNNARQIANMQQSYNNQIANLQAFNDVGSRLDNCCCENRLATQDLKATVISENCSDREVLRQIGQDILVNQTANTQKIIDEIFRDRLDEKQDKIEELNRQLLMKDLQASQISQTQAITSNIYNELKNCPVGTIPVFGNQPIFTCPNNNGCGCGFNTTSQFI